MKIAVFTDYFYPELGGIQDSIATTTKELARRGHDIEIFAPRYGQRDFRMIGADPGECDLGPNVRVNRRLAFPFPSSTRQSRAAVISPLTLRQMRARGRPDIIHAHSFFGLGLEALLAGTRLRIPVIGTNHTTIAGFAPYIPVMATTAASYVRWFYNRCDHVTAPSQDVFDELEFDRSRGQIISNPIDTDLFTPPDPAQRAAAKLRFGLTGPVVTFAGRLGPEKNVDVVIKSIAHLVKAGPTVTLAIAGHGSHAPVLRSLVETTRIGAHVRFLGTLSQPDLADLMRASDIFSIMSTSETQSMVLLQAMASGLPAVAAASRALVEFVRPDQGVLVDPHDDRALSVTLGALLTSPERRSAMGAAGRQFAETYGVDSVTTRWEQIYRAISQWRSDA